MILIDQLKEVYIDGVLDTVDTTNWYPKIMRKDYTSGSISLRPASTIPTRNSTRIMCAARSAQRNYTGYCNREVDALVERQSAESDQARRKQLVWEIERKMAEDDARPVLFYGRIGTCWQPQLKGLRVMVNSIYNMSRFEDIWLDK